MNRTIRGFIYSAFSLLIVFASYAGAQKLPEPSGIKVPVFADPVITIDFSDHIREWDGFGVIYVNNRPVAWSNGNLIFLAVTTSEGDTQLPAWLWQVLAM